MVLKSIHLFYYSLRRDNLWEGSHVVASQLPAFFFHIYYLTRPKLENYLIKLLSSYNHIYIDTYMSLTYQSSDWEWWFKNKINKVYMIREKGKIINDHFRIKIPGIWKYSKYTILLTNIYAIMQLDCKRDMYDIGNRYPRMRIMK